MEKEITLYDINKKNGDEFILRAYIKNGCLYIEGHDFSNAAQEFFGEEEYEYFYSFSKEDTTKLAAVFGNKDLLLALNEFFNGEMKNDEFEKICSDNNIQYKVFSI